MKINISNFITENKGWSFQQIMENAGVQDEIEYHQFTYGTTPKRIYIMPQWEAMSEKYNTTYYNGKHAMTLMPC